MALVIAYRTCFLDLPTEAVHEILKFLSEIDVIGLSHVCKQLHGDCRPYLLANVHDIYVDEFSPTVSAFSGGYLFSVKQALVKSHLRFCQRYFIDQDDINFFSATRNAFEQQLWRLTSTNHDSFGFSYQHYLKTRFLLQFLHDVQKKYLSICILQNFLTAAEADAEDWSNLVFDDDLDLPYRIAPLSFYKTQLQICELRLRQHNQQVLAASHVSPNPRKRISAASVSTPKQLRRSQRTRKV